MTTILVIVAVALALTAGWALMQLAEASGGPPAPVGGDLMVLEHSPVGALLLDPGLRVTWANDTFCRFFGLARAEVVGQKMPDLIRVRMKATVAEPAAFESGLLTAYAPGSTPTPLKHAALHQKAEVRRRAELEKALVDLSRKRTLAKGDRRAALRETSKAAAITLGGARAELWLLSSARDLWTLHHYFDPSTKRHKTTAHEVKAADVQEYFGVIEEVRVLCVTDAKIDPRSGGLVGQGVLEPVAGASLDVPVRLYGKVVGTLVLADHGRRNWTPEEERFAASVGDRLSMVLESTERREATSSPIAVPGPILDTDPLDGFVHLDEDLCFTYLNPTVLRWLEERGRDGAALVGTGLVESLRGVEDTAVIAEVRKAARGGGPAQLRRQFEAGGPWLDVYINPSEDGVSVTLQNKARRYEKEAQRSLLESETRFRSVVESLGEGLIITDLQDRIVYVNPRIIELTGRRPEDLAGRSAQELVFDTKNWKNAQVRLAARKDRKRMQYKAPLLHKDGHAIGVEVISSPLRNADGDVTGVVDAVTDLSNQPAQESAS